jgi:hypothetical protein
MEATPPQETPPLAPAPPDVAESLRLVEGLSRLFAVAAIYAPTHVRVASLADPVLALVAAACGDSRLLAFDVREDGLALNRVALPLSHPATARLRADLAGVGVHRLEIDATVAAKDLVALARALRTHAQPRTGSQGFRHVELTGLPDSIRAVQHDFGLPTFDETEHVGSGMDLDVALGERPAGSAPEEASSADGTTPGAQRPEADAAPKEDDTDRISLVLNLAIEQAARDAPGAPPEPTEASRTPRGRREILRAIAESLHRAVQRAGGRPSTQTVADILEGARANLPALAPSVPAQRLMDALREAIDLHLRDAFRREGVTALDAPAQGRMRDPLGPDDVGRLTEQVGGFVDASEPFLAAGRSSEDEHLGILLNLLVATQPGALRDALVCRVAPYLAAPPTEERTAMLRGWLLDLVRRNDVGEVDQLLPILLGPYRAHGAACVADLLLSAFRPPAPEALRLLWPYLVDAALVPFDAEDRPLEDELISCLTRLDPADVLAHTDRLALMPAVKKGLLSRRLFQPIRPDLYGFYEVCLNLRRAPHLATQVVEAFFRSPPNTPAAGVLTVLGPREDRTRSFLGRIVRENRGGGETPALRKLAAEAIAEAIRTCPPMRRAEAWVLRAIGALRALPGPASVAALRIVVGEKRFGILPAWPTAARSAARDVLRPAGAAGGAAPTRAPLGRVV